ncbi:proteoglycan 4 [Nylanderia fulva]|uniref:proteoglycan 4 n=1 Tax=Nylanderia fulva TaxID=613905 RepID=UPI0010FB719C|nr:proteoglycan 4 [Nylanderia fulva]XP_029155597.1 proteoglycan 4 [Nylanderia fulva]
MSAAVRERTTTHTSRKLVTHGGPISGQRDGAATASSLENNLDALLEDLQTSVSRSATPSRDRALAPQVEYRVAANPIRVFSEGGRPISPNRSKVTTTEKFVSTGPTGTSSGIPGLEFLDEELKDVQPGQSKTIAYKQVSYQYNKDLDGKPDSWAISENKRPGAPLIDDIHETSYEETKTPALSTYQSPEPIIKKSVVNRELIYGDSSTSHSKQTSPLSGTQRDVKYIQETSSYQADPRSTQSVTTVRTSTPQEYKTIEYVSTPSPAIPINLQPGPNTKVTTTIKTYTYELPGSPETYLPGGSVPRGNVVLPGDQTITYTLPGRSSTTATTDKTVTYQTVTENVPPDPPVRYNSPTSTDVTEKSTTIHKEAKFYREELLDDRPGWKPSNVYQRNAPTPTNLETKTTVTEKYYQVDDNYPNGHGPVDRPDYPRIYQNQPPTVEHTKSIKRIEEYRSDRHPTSDKSDKVTTTAYWGPPNTTIYKFSNTTTTVPPGKNADDHEVLLPKPFPTGVQMYPTKPTSNGEGPPAKLEDLMASFSDSEREVLEDIERQERQNIKGSSSKKKEVDFIPHTPPKVKSKNVAGPPVYYPPGSAEFTKKEESSAAMSQASGGWQKASGKYEYEASSKSKTKTSKGGAVVPVCLPLCCALPCVIM